MSRKYQRLADLPSSQNFNIHAVTQSHHHNTTHLPLPLCSHYSVLCRDNVNANQHYRTRSKAWWFGNYLHRRLHRCPCDSIHRQVSPRCHPHTVAMDLTCWDRHLSFLMPFLFPENGIALLLLHCCFHGDSTAKLHHDTEQWWTMSRNYRTSTRRRSTS